MLILDWGEFLEAVLDEIETGAESVVVAEDPERVGTTNEWNDDRLRGRSEHGE
ncbi:hypothetical protein [Halodesulfurarchaeum sp.]|uniref:hypothetical protein n=1 Tax=Halodesulfurarchaeum sp. TaxID=1980530 RepID=UPI002FC32947